MAFSASSLVAFSRTLWAGVDEVFGLLQAQAGEGPELLDDLDLLVAVVGEEHVELVLLLGGVGASPAAGAGPAATATGAAAVTPNSSSKALRNSLSSRTVMFLKTSRSSGWSGWPCQLSSAGVGFGRRCLRVGVGGRRRSGRRDGAAGSLGRGRLGFGSAASAPAGSDAAGRAVASGAAAGRASPASTLVDVGVEPVGEVPGERLEQPGGFSNT